MDDTRPNTSAWTQKVPGSEVELTQLDGGKVPYPPERSFQLLENSVKFHESSQTNCSMPKEREIRVPARVPQFRTTQYHALYPTSFPPRYRKLKNSVHPAHAESDS